MKKSVNLKRRLDELRDEAEPPMEMTLTLEADLYRTLKQLAAQEKLSLEAYIVKILSSHTETVASDSKSG